ncbi:hypothetical protein HDZ31DRAFT_39020 [Schizophyllum fasciatum]
MAEPATSPSAAQTKLTWAERAKKAQGPSKPPSTTPQAVPSSGAAAANYRSSAASTISTSSAGSTLVSSVKSSASVSSPTDVHTPASSVVATTRPSSPASQPKALNGDAQNSPSAAAPAPSPKKPPTVNVWALRKEQMISTQSSVVSGAQSATTGSSPSLSATASPAVSMAPTSTQNDEDDAFVVKHRPQQWNVQWSRPSAPPAVEDKESWPEIGKALSPPTTGTAIRGSTRSSTSEASQGARDEDGPRASSSTRKGEKPKWIPIPAEELQAAADANMRRQGRNPQARSNFRSSGSFNAGSSSTYSRGPSTAASRVPSMPHSRAQSVANSRIQSRAGSVHTSPFVSMKQLPDGDRRSSQAGASADANGSVGKDAAHANTAFAPGPSSAENANCPRPYESNTRPYEPPHVYGQPIPAHAYHPPLGAHPFYPSSAPPSQNESPYSSHAPSPYPPMPMGYPSHTHSPSYSAHGVSPTFSYPPHALPPNGLPHPPPLPFFSGQALPPNGPYAPYPYGAPPVAAHVPHTSVESEILVSHTPRVEEAAGEGRSAPARPPAPEASAAVAGYRNIAENERKPAVVFGSIAPDGTQLSGPLSPQQTGGAGAAPPSSVQETEKAFPRFTIGVKPAEGGKANGVEKENLPVAGDREIIDLTGQEPAPDAPKWRFGSTGGADGGAEGAAAAGHAQKPSASASTDTDLERHRACGARVAGGPAAARAGAPARGRALPHGEAREGDGRRQRRRWGPARVRRPRPEGRLRRAAVSPARAGRARLPRRALRAGRGPDTAAAAVAV